MILDQVRVLEAERVPLAEAAGRILAEDFSATWDLPHWDNSAMDGYAVRSEDCTAPRTLRLSGYHPAGEAATTPLQPQTAAKILTGAPIPPGADAVIPIEDTELLGGGEEVRLQHAVARGAHVRRKGEDVTTGQRLLPAGRRLGAPEIAALASFSQLSVSVARRPRVAILATGDELVEPGEPLSPGKLHNSNSVALAAAVQEAGAEPLLLGIARDNPESLRERLEHGFAKKVDALITSAGVSAGDRDFVRDVLEALGVRQLFWKVEMKPGHPTAFGMRGETPVFALPGNPVSTLIAFDQLVRPALLKMGGQQRCLRRTIRASFSGADFKKKPGRVFFLRVRLTRQGESWLAEPAGSQETGILRTLVDADGIAVIPAECDKVGRGQELEVHLLREELGYLPLA